MGKPVVRHGREALPCDRPHAPHAAEADLQLSYRQFLNSYTKLGCAVRRASRSRRRQALLPGSTEAPSPDGQRRVDVTRPSQERMRLGGQGRPLAARTPQRERRERSPPPACAWAAAALLAV